MSLEDSVRRALAEHAGDVSAEPDVGALVARGTQARRRRRLAIAVSVVATAVVGAVVAGPILTNTAELAPPVVGTPAPGPTPAGTPTSAGPRSESGFFAGSANVPVRYTVPAGWESVETIFVTRSGADPAFGVAFYDVANLYADGCRWRQLDPPVGPTVDDLVAAYRDVPDLEATPAADVTIDGFSGRQLGYTVPDYDAADCRDATYALAQADNAGTGTPQEGAPNLWALAPGQQHRVSILDVDGTRLAVFVMTPPNLSAEDRADLDEIVESLRIGPG